MAQGDPASSLQHSLSAAGLSAGMTHSMSSYYHPNGIAAHAHAAAAVGQMSAAHHPAFLPPHHHTARDFRDAAGSLQVHHTIISINILLRYNKFCILSSYAHSSWILPN